MRHTVKDNDDDLLIPFDPRSKLRDDWSIWWTVIGGPVMFTVILASALSETLNFLFKRFDLLHNILIFTVVIFMHIIIFIITNNIGTGISEDGKER